MYKVTISFAMDNLRTYKQGEILAEDFTTQDEITDLLQAGYIIEYDGSLEITENGTYDIREYETAEVNVGGGGGETSDVLTNIITENGGNSYRANQLLKKVENIEISDSITSFYQMFGYCLNLEILTFKNVPVTRITNFGNAFRGCSKLVELDLSNFEVSPTLIDYCFSDCTNLQKIDVRNFDFSLVTNKTFPFDNVSANCLIIVKDNTQKAWINSNFPAMTNVKTVAEL